MQTLFADPKAEAEARFRYLSAERMETRWRARSAWKPAGGRGAHVPPWQMVDKGGNNLHYDSDFSRKQEVDEKD
jgi:hypothetical protein